MRMQTLYICPENTQPEALIRIQAINPEIKFLTKYQNTTRRYIEIFVKEDNKALEQFAVALWSNEHAQETTNQVIQSLKRRGILSQEMTTETILLNNQAQIDTGATNGQPPSIQLPNILSVHESPIQVTSEEDETERSDDDHYPPFDSYSDSLVSTHTDDDLTSIRRLQGIDAFYRRNAVIFTGTESNIENPVLQRAGSRVSFLSMDDSDGSRDTNLEDRSPVADSLHSRA